MKFDARINVGDIMLDKDFKLLSFRILHALFIPPTILTWPSKKKPKQMSHHSGVIGIHNSIEGVFESLPGKGFIFTPWDEYAKDVREETVQLKIVRFPQLTEQECKQVNDFLNTKLKEKIIYDYSGAISLIFWALLKRTWPRWENTKRWYCTELVQEAFASIGKHFLPEKLPTPYDLEKLVRDGVLVEIADYYKM